MRTSIEESFEFICQRKKMNMVLCSSEGLLIFSNIKDGERLAEAIVYLLTSSEKLKRRHSEEIREIVAIKSTGYAIMSSIIVEGDEYYLYAEFEKPYSLKKSRNIFRSLRKYVEKTLRSIISPVQQI